MDRQGRLQVGIFAEVFIGENDVPDMVVIPHRKAISPAIKSVSKFRIARRSFHLGLVRLKAQVCLVYFNRWYLRMIGKGNGLSWIAKFFDVDSGQSDSRLREL